MEKNTDQRQYIRYPLGLEATAVAGNKTHITRCLVHTISHSGASMDLHTEEELAAGQNIMLGIAFPERKLPMNMIVKLKWVKGLDDEGLFNTSVGGVIVFIKDEDRKELLDYAFTQVLAAEKKKEKDSGR